MQRKFKNVSVYVSAFIGNLLAFVAGITFSWSSPMLPKLNGSKDSAINPLGRPATLLEESWIASLPPLGAAFGPLIVGLAADKLGRKKTLMILACPVLVSLLILAFAKSIPEFCVARFIMGVGSGSVFSILPLYLVEIAEDYNRGTVSCLFSNFVASGVLFTYAVGPLLNVQNFCLVCIIPLVVFIPACFIWNLESPQFLASINNQKELKICLSKLRNHKNVEELEKEVLDVATTVQELNQNQSTVKDLFKSKVLQKGLILTIGTITLQQFSGIGAVISYMQTIFEAAQTGFSSELSVIITGVVQVFITIVTSLLVDILGRKILLLTSIIGSCLCLVVLGVYFFLKGHDYSIDTISWLPVTSLIMYIVCFNIGLGPIPWTIMAELFPPNVKAKAATITSSINFLLNFIIAFIFPPMSSYFGMDLTFWFFAIICFVGAIAIYYFLPETKGKSLKELQILLK